LVRADASCAEVKLPSDAAPDATVVIAPVSGVDADLPVQRQLPDPKLRKVKESPATVKMLAPVGNIRDVLLWVNVSAPENIKVRSMPESIVPSEVMVVVPLIVITSPVTTPPIFNEPAEASAELPCPRLTMALNARKYSSGPVLVVTESDPAGLLLEAVTLRLSIVVGTAIIYPYRKGVAESKPPPVDTAVSILSNNPLTAVGIFLSTGISAFNALFTFPAFFTGDTRELITLAATDILRTLSVVALAAFKYAAAEPAGLVGDIRGFVLTNAAILAARFSP
jgi:hypothetical protein